MFGNTATLNIKIKNKTVTEIIFSKCQKDNIVRMDVPNGGKDPELFCCIVSFYFKTCIFFFFEQNNFLQTTHIKPFQKWHSARLKNNKPFGQQKKLKMQIKAARAHS
jgi:hypothetical protein